MNKSNSNNAMKIAMCVVLVGATFNSLPMQKAQDEIENKQEEFKNLVDLPFDINDPYPIDYEKNNCSPGEQQAALLLEDDQAYSNWIFSHSQPEKLVVITTCLACGEMVPEALCERNVCEHKVCYDCLKGQFYSCYRDRKPSQLRCKFYKKSDNTFCNTPISVECIKKLKIPKSDFDKFFDIAAEEVASTDSSFKHCPIANCDYCYLDESIKSKNISCPKCKKTYCCKCLVYHTENLTCEEFKKYLSESEKRVEEWKEKNTKPCPNCQVRIEKNEGCAHMTCKNCSYEFCWLCDKRYYEGHIREEHSRAAVQPTPAPRFTPTVPSNSLLPNTVPPGTIPANGDTDPLTRLMLAAYNVIPPASPAPTNTSSNLGINPPPASSMPSFQANYSQQNRYGNPYALPYSSHLFTSQHYGDARGYTPIRGPLLPPPTRASYQAGGYYPSLPTYPIPGSRYTPPDIYGTPYVSPYSLGQFSSQNYGNELWSTPISGSSVNTPNASYLPPANTQHSGMNLPELPSDSSISDNGGNRQRESKEYRVSSQPQPSVPPMANAESSAQIKLKKSITSIFAKKLKRKKKSVFTMSKNKKRSKK